MSRPPPLFWPVVGFILFAAACGADSASKATTVPTDNTERGDSVMKLTSVAFVEGGEIPAEYSCDGADVSPPLEWSGAPGKTSCFALLVDDPDAPVGDWVHWLLFNIPSGTNALKEGVALTDTELRGAISGTNSWRRTGYGGPCPPSGRHRYFFKLTALDTTLALSERATKADLVRAMQGHILAEAKLMGTYSRRR